VNASTHSGIKETPFKTALFIQISDAGYFKLEAKKVNMSFAARIISECDGIGYINYDAKIDQFQAMAHALGTGNKFKKGKERIIRRFSGNTLESFLG